MILYSFGHASVRVFHRLAHLSLGVLLLRYRLNSIMVVKKAYRQIFWLTPPQLQSFSGFGLFARQSSDLQLPRDSDDPFKGVSRSVSLQSIMS